MSAHQKYLELFAALAGFFGVFAGALAAHKTQDIYVAALLQKASFYLLVHAVAILALAGRNQWPARIACLLFALGSVLFGGGLCLRVFSGIAAFAVVIPIGGTLLILGWLVLLALPFSRKQL